MVWISNGRDYSLSWKPWLFENPDHLKSDLQKVRISNGRTSDPHCSWTLKKIEQKNIDLVNLFQLSRRAAQPSSSFRTCARCSASTLRWTNRRATDQQGLQSKRKVRNQFYPDCRLTKNSFIKVVDWQKNTVLSRLSLPFNRTSKPLKGNQSQLSFKVGYIHVHPQI